MTRRIIGADRQHVYWEVVDLGQADVVHLSSVVAETRKKLFQIRLLAIADSRSDGRMTLLVLFLVGLAVGVTTVLFGFGGGFVTVPIILIVDASRGGDAVRIAVATSALVMVVNAVIATASTRRSTLKHLRGRRVLFVLLALGGAAGATAALFVPDTVPRWGFVAYIAVTVVDLLLRPGFLPRRVTLEPAREVAGRGLPNAWGAPIGTISSFLGVGGSVMTVPMMRRSGMELSLAASLANPLTIAIAAPAMMVAFAFGGEVASGAGLVGTVDVASALALLTGAAPAIVLLRRRPPRIPEAVHGWAYVALLVVAATTVALTG